MSAGYPTYEDPLVRAKIAEVENVYRRLGYQYGWNFITCPFEYRKSSKLLLVSLNPGGREDTFRVNWSQEKGSAYEVEDHGKGPGKSPLQQQVLRLYETLGLRTNEVFSAHFIPFRSPRIEAMDHRSEAEAYATKLWKWLLPQVNFERIVCLGVKLPANPIAKLLGCEFVDALPTGWGNTQAKRYRLPDGRQMIALPHLGTFKLFGREECREPLSSIFGPFDTLAQKSVTP